jgi:hypothetical protein
MQEDVIPEAQQPPHTVRNASPEEIREFLQSEGLGDILQETEPHPAERRGGDNGTPEALSPRDHNSLTDASLLEVSCGMAVRKGDVSFKTSQAQSHPATMPAWACHQTHGHLRTVVQDRMADICSKKGCSWIRMPAMGVLRCEVDLEGACVQEMNEILMLDLGGLGGFRSPLGSPPPPLTSDARFSFADQAHGLRPPPEADPLQPSWRVAEVREHVHPAQSLEIL